VQAAPEAGSRRQVLLGVAFAFGAAIAYGASQVITRQNVSGVTPPLVGSALALFWGTLGFSVLAVRSFALAGQNFRRGMPYFAAAGIFSALGVVGLFQALERGEVVVVSPVVSTNPLFTLLLAALILREVERISVQVVVGAVFVVAGVVLLSVA
jgi:drug/metabolite transporter (DMT)-like permease